MLRKVRKAVEETSGVATVAELSDRTGLDRATVLQMLEALADHGRLVRLGTACAPGALGCGACRLARSCEEPRAHAYKLNLR